MGKFLTFQTTLQWWFCFCTNHISFPFSPCRNMPSKSKVSLLVSLITAHFHQRLPRPFGRYGRTRASRSASGEPTSINSTTRHHSEFTQSLPWQQVLTCTSSILYNTEVQKRLWDISPYTHLIYSADFKQVRMMRVVLPPQVYNVCTKQLSYKKTN